MNTLDARSYLAHLRTNGVVSPKLGDTVVLALHPAATARRSRSHPSPFGSVQLPRRGVPIPTVTPIGPGPAVAAMTVDLLAESGVGTIVGIGIASHVDRDGQPPPRAVVIGAAISDESVSARYDERLLADPALTRKLLDTVEHADVGIAYTTAAPFRVDTSKVMASAALVIEMEASALFAAGNRRGVKVGLVVVPSDRTAADHWVPLPAGPVAESVGAIANRIRATLVEDQ